MKPTTGAAHRVFLALILSLFIPFSHGVETSASAAETIVRHPDPASPLMDRWKWARSEGEKRGFTKGYWIGYSILRLMSENSYIGTFYSESRLNHPSLGELLTGTEQFDIRARSTSGDEAENEGVTIGSEGNSSGRKVMKEVAVLLHFSENRSDEPDRTKISNLTLHVEFDDNPLVWLGAAADGESIEFLKSRFASAGAKDVRKEIVTAIGLHGPSPAVFSILGDLLTGSGYPEVRGESAFWLGRTNTDEALSLLMHAANSDGSDKVRDQAVFGISQMEGDRGLDALINLAQKGSGIEVQKKAAFWLGERASQKATATLKDIVYSNKETELQKNALFALTQCTDDKGIDDIITIAKTHPNPKIRKEAIFWLGQSENKRAVEALIDIVRK